MCVAVLLILCFGVALLRAQEPSSPEEVEQAAVHGVAVEGGVPTRASCALAAVGLDEVGFEAVHLVLGGASGNEREAEVVLVGLVGCHVGGHAWRRAVLFGLVLSLVVTTADVCTAHGPVG